MIKLADYIISEKLFESQDTIVYRGIRKKDSQPIIVKFLNQENPSKERLLSFTHEYEISKKISGKDTIFYYELVKHNNTLGFVMEDIGGASLSQVIKIAAISLSEKISISIKIAEKLSLIHKKNIIHKDINPSNIIWNSEINRLEIIDYGNAIEIKREMTNKMEEYLLEGSPYYCSPEQARLINRPTDNRSDLYSLGVTLYELFTSQLPYASINDKEVIFSHITKKPEPPHLIKKNIPEMISIILLKLLAKDPEERYQDVSGVKKDLERCLENIRFGNDIIPFVIGKFDFSCDLRNSYKLYGRQEAIEKLNVSYNDVANGKSAIVMIEGNAGYGKTRLVQEFNQMVSLKKGLFVSGRFDPLTSNTPLHGIIQASHQLMQWLLSLPEIELEYWRKKILSTITSNIGILSSILPELEQIIGAQPEAPDINHYESHNQFLIIFYNFVSLFATTNHPFVIFFDDLQWCDPTSLNVINYFVNKRKPSNILFIGAYRKSDLEINNPVIHFIETLKREKSTVQTLTLQPLEITDIDQMVVDTFHRSHSDEETLSLTNLIYQKTGGSPFHIHHLLEVLFEQGLFEVKEEKWIWDINQIQSNLIFNNETELINHKMKKFSKETTELLKIASCIGIQFDLSLLSLVSNRKPAEVGTLLWPVIKSELIYPLDQNYKLMLLEEHENTPSSFQIRLAFQHNRIQQLLYFQIPILDRQAIHLKIGKNLFLSIKENENPDYLINMISHMNIGRSLITDYSERRTLCKLNSDIATKILKLAIPTITSKYLSIAESLLTKEEWNHEPIERYHILSNLSEALFFSSELTKAEEICNQLLSLSNKPLDQGKVYILKARSLELQGFLSDSIDEIRKGLQLFGVTLPSKSEEIEQRIDEEMVEIDKIIKENMIESLADLPLMEDKNKLTIMELLFYVVTPAIQYNPSLFTLSALIMFKMSQKYGVSVYSCKNFVDLGIIKELALKDYSIGYRLGMVAFRLIDRLKAESIKPAVYFCFSFSSYKNKHYQETLHYYEMTYSAALQNGNFHYASYALVNKVLFAMHVGKKLSDCKTEAIDTIQFLKEIKAETPLLLANIVLYMIKKYMSLEKIDNDDEITSKIRSQNNLAFLWRFYHYNTMYYYIHQNWEEANKWSQFSDHFQFERISDYPGPDHSMLKGLLIVKLWNTYSDKEKEELKETIYDILNDLKRNAEYCPSNFAHKYHFLSAEVGILEGKDQNYILNHYNKAIDSLKDNDFSHIKGLIFESLANFWQSKENEMIAKAYLREAHNLFTKWGALKKTQLMETQHPFLQTSFFKSSSTKSLYSNSNKELDISSVMKSIQMISKEVQIDKLLNTLMTIFLENTGARQGALLLVNEEDKELYIEAEKKSFNDKIEVQQSIPYRKSTSLCTEIIQYVTRSLENMVLGNAYKEGAFKKSPHIIEKQIRSILSIPILSQKKLMGVIYLEHDLAEDFFSEDRIQLLKIIASQAVISIENARLFESYEKKIHERTEQLNNANEKLKLLSLQDPLTTLHNRRYISEFVSELSMNFITRKMQLQKIVEKRDLSITKKVIGIFMLDLDHFKKINDDYGYHSGDKVIIAISKMIKNTIRADDFVVRWEGEKFLVILNCTNPDYLDTFANKILKAVENCPIILNEKKIINVTCSVGYCMMPIHILAPDLLNLKQVINISDIALHIAKENGRNRIARISVNANNLINEECKEYLQKMSKDEPINKEFVEVIL